MAAKPVSIAIKIVRDKNGKYYIDEPIQAAAKRKLEAAYEVGKPRLTHVTIPQDFKPKPKTKKVKKNVRKAGGSTVASEGTGTKAGKKTATANPGGKTSGKKRQDNRRSDAGTTGKNQSSRKNDSRSGTSASK